MNLNYVWDNSPALAKTEFSATPCVIVRLSRKHNILASITLDRHRTPTTHLDVKCTVVTFHPFEGLAGDLN